MHKSSLSILSLCTGLEHPFAAEVTGCDKEWEDLNFRGLASSH